MPGRAQNKKVRPIIRLTDTLRAWLIRWDRAYPIHDAHGTPIAAIDNRTIQKAAKRAGIVQWQKFTRYTFRHYMATRIRRIDGVRVSSEERARWMGHIDPNFRTTQKWYESFDPNYLASAAQATDALMTMLNKKTKRKLVLLQQRSDEKLTSLKTRG
jgi:integrase